MSNELPYTLIDGIRCYSPQVANSYADYPDSGFDVTDKNSEGSFWVRSRNRLFKKIVYNQMPSKSKARLLEIGCGTGNFIQHIKDNENLLITGSEIYIKGLLYAKKKLPDIDFIQFDISEGGVTEKFDLVVAFDVLEHIENDSAAMLNIHNMLEKGGKLILTVPQYMFLWSRLDEIVKHKRRYSRREMLDKLESNGFEITYSTSFVCMLFPLMLISRLMDKSRAHLNSDEQELEKRVMFPGFIDKAFDLVMRFDEYLIRMGVELPFGGTLIVIARKP